MKNLDIIRHINFWTVVVLFLVSCHSEFIYTYHTVGGGNLWRLHKNPIFPATITRAVEQQKMDGSGTYTHGSENNRPGPGIRGRSALFTIIKTINSRDVTFCIFIIFGADKWSALWAHVPIINI